jgi:hypothetical protein
MENQEQNTVDQSSDAAVQQPQLTIADLQNIKQIIEVAAKRGAFNTTEFTAIGTTVDRLNAFLVAITPPADAPAADATAESTDAPAAEEATDAPAADATEESTDAPAAEETDSTEEPTAE